MLEIKTVVIGDADAGILLIIYNLKNSLGKTSLSERFCYGDAPLSTIFALTPT